MEKAHTLRVEYELPQPLRGSYHSQPLYSYLPETVYRVKGMGTSDLTVVRCVVSLQFPGDMCVHVCAYASLEYVCISLFPQHL